MKTASKLFVLAAALATSPLAARADHDDRRDGRYDDRRSDDRSERYVPPAPQPYRPGPRWDPDSRWDEVRRDEPFERWCGLDRGRADHRGAGYWRQAEWRDLRRDYWELERTRDRFYAAGWHPRRDVRRFERWYAWKRSELERRRDALVIHVAWR